MAEAEAVKRLTVMQVLPGLEAGGVERGTVEVSRALVETGHRSVVVSSGGRLVGELEEHGAEHVEMPVHRKSLRTLGCVWPMRRLVRELSVDVLHPRSRVPAWVAYLAWRKMPAGDRPAFVTSVHGLYSVNRYSRVMTFGQRVEVVSETVRDYVLQNYPGTDPSKLVLNHRGVDPAEYPFGYRPSAEWQTAWRAKYPELEGRFVIALAGRITRLKGHHDLLDALAKLVEQGVNAHALIVGGEDPRRKAYAQELRDVIGWLGIQERVTFTGHRSDIREVLAVSDAVVSLSTKPESFGRAVLEAVRLGRPVVGYDHGGVGEVLAEVYSEGRTPLGDREALVDRLTAIAEQRVEPPGPTEAFPLSGMLERSVAFYDSAVADFKG
ncbi:MAG: glycosyltransferase family 4 protein [Planctomycetota bacterium]